MEHAYYCLTKVLQTLSDLDEVCLLVFLHSLPPGVLLFVESSYGHHVQHRPLRQYLSEIELAL